MNLGSTMVYGYPYRDEKGVSKFWWIKFIQPHCNRIHKNGKQVAVYLATTKNRLTGISKTLLIHRYNTTSLYVPREKENYNGGLLSLHEIRV